jgi:hypothetical protein
MHSRCEEGPASPEVCTGCAALKINELKANFQVFAQPLFQVALFGWAWKRETGRTLEADASLVSQIIAAGGAGVRRKFVGTLLEDNHAEVWGGNFAIIIYIYLVRGSTGCVSHLDVVHSGRLCGSRSP